MAEGFVPFSVRYGIHDDTRFADHEGHDRHLWSANPPAESRCVCLGTSHVRCSAVGGSEDRLCAECRSWCWGVTPSGRQVPLARLLDSANAESPSTAP